MPASQSDTVVVGITATALFDLREADSQFEAMRHNDPDTAIRQYRDAGNVQSHC